MSYLEYYKENKKFVVTNAPITSVIDGRMTISMFENSGWTSYPNAICMKFISTLDITEESVLRTEACVVGANKAVDLIQKKLLELHYSIWLLNAKIIKKDIIYVRQL